MIVCVWGGGGGGGGGGYLGGAFYCMVAFCFIQRCRDGTHPPPRVSAQHNVLHLLGGSPQLHLSFHVILPQKPGSKLEPRLIEIVSTFA